MNINDEMTSSDVIEKTASDYQLLRIIIIDSYCKGKKVELKLDGHVSLNGGNGAGKTTLLRLIPIFFGESPKKVIFGKYSFATYYFPTTSSYIVFEYKRRDTKVLAVIHGDGQNDSVVYRFIDNAYEDRLFRTENNFVQSQDFYKHVQNLNIPISDKFNRSEYEQIITNTATKMEIRKIAARFSFVGTGNKLNHIGRVITGILNRVTEFSDLKKMVASNAIGEDKQFKLNTNKNDLIKWIKELKSHQALEEKRPLMSLLEDAEAKRNLLLSDMGTLHSRFHSLIKHLEETKLDISEKLEIKEKESNKLESEFRAEQDKLNSSKSEVKAEWEQKVKNIGLLQERFNRYKSDGIDESCILVDSLEDFKNEFNRLERTINDLSGEIKNIDDKFDKLKNIESKVLQEQLYNELLNKNTIQENSRIEIEAAKEQKEKISAQHKDAHLSVLEGLKELLLEANNIVIGLKAKQPLIVGDASIQNDLDEALKKQSFENESFKKANQSFIDATSKENIERRKFEDQERLCNEVSLMLEKAEDEYNSVLEFSSAGRETLIGFLRAERSDWVDDIGKIINQEILLRKDLEPRIADGSSLYGIDISLDKIKLSKLSSEEKIQLELGNAKSKIEKAKKACDEENITLEILSKNLKAANTEKSLCEAHKEKSVNLSRDLTQKVEILKARLEYSKKLAKENVRIELEAAIEKHKDITTSISIEENKFESTLKELNAELAKKVESVKLIEKSALKGIVEKEQELQKSYDKKIEDLDNSRLEMLAGKGVDPNHLAKLEKEKSNLDGKIIKANAIFNNVHSYREWLKNSYGEIEKISLDESRLKIELHSIATELISTEKTFKTKHSMIIEEAHALSTIKNKTGKDIGDTNNQLDSISRWPRNSIVEHLPHDSAYTLHDLILDKKRIIDEEAAHLKTIAAGVTEIRQEMMREPGTEVDKFCRATEMEVGSPVTNREYEWLRVCRIWFNEGYKSKQDSLIADGRSQGMAIKNFYDSLNNMQSEIASFNRNIRDSLGKAKMFTRINSVDIIITTDIDKQDYWTAINELKNQYDLWHPTAAISMPPTSFVDAANDVMKILKDDRGLVANATDLINIRIDATINGIDVSAKEEKELKEMSSNGLSYLVLAIVMVGFVNKIRGENKIAIPYAVDEVMDIDHINSVSLLEFLELNNIMLIGAFPDVSERLSPYFKHKYVVLDDKQIASVEIQEVNILGEAAYV